MSQPPLTPLHSDQTLVTTKLETYRKLSDQVLIESLKPGKREALKARPDGTVLDGHHRIKVLRERGLDVDTLPREVIPKDPTVDPP